MIFLLLQASEALWWKGFCGSSYSWCWFCFTTNHWSCSLY